MQVNTRYITLPDTHPVFVDSAQALWTSFSFRLCQNVSIFISFFLFLTPSNSAPFSSNNYNGVRETTCSELLCMRRVNQNLPWPLPPCKSHHKSHSPFDTYPCLFHTANPLHCQSHHKSHSPCILYALHLSSFDTYPGLFHTDNPLHCQSHHKSHSPCILYALHLSSFDTYPCLFHTDSPIRVNVKFSVSLHLHVVNPANKVNVKITVFFNAKVVYSENSRKRNKMHHLKSQSQGMKDTLWKSQSKNKLCTYSSRLAKTNTQKTQQPGDKIQSIKHMQ